MQYHFDGFRAGDPLRQPAVDDAGQLPAEVDVLIVGCGPAGLTLAAQLAAFPDISTRIVERKAGPLIFGQADGIACRSVEMFQAFGFAHKVMQEAYWVNETTFWRPDEAAGQIARADRIQDVEDDLSEMPHVILSQARVHDFFLEVMRNGGRRLEPEYQRSIVSLDREDGADHPVVARIEGPEGDTETLRARYVVGCDGARSIVRQQMGLALEGESAQVLWGVMDVLVVTDFPDIRLKTAIQSSDAGSVLIIPREGGTLVRVYVELEELAPSERVADRDVTPARLIAKAQSVFAPYSFDVKDVAWCSAYVIGQRVCPRFDDRAPGRDPRIFIAGDACHTHSPKAGQGMNVSMADTFNLGWKLAAVLRGQSPDTLLMSYSEERQAKAQELIDFDRDMARLFVARGDGPEAAAAFQRYFQQHGRYTAGVETQYDPSSIACDATHQALASGLTIGKRFHSAPVVRLGDAKRVELGHMFLADGRWRIVLFAPEGDTGAPGGAVAAMSDWLARDPDSPAVWATPNLSDADSVIDLRAVFQSSHRDLDLGRMPTSLLPRKGGMGLIDYEKIFCPDPKRGPDIFDHRGIDRQRGALVVVRPDQFVAAILPIDDRAGLAEFFRPILLPA